VPARKPADLSLRACVLCRTVLKGRPHGGKPLGRRGVDVLAQPKLPEVSTLEERSLLSFQRPAPTEFQKLVRRRKKASDSRQRPPRNRIVSDTSRAWRLLWSLDRDFRTPTVRTASEV
jgi:hypothetical protein